MNILPKKRWHVRTKENIARVRRDEALAAEQEQERQRRVALAEQEFRTSILRKRAAERHGTIGDTSGEQRAELKAGQDNPERNASIVETSGHINFFQHLEEGEKVAAPNQEYLREQREEKEKYEKSIGYLTYLGQGSREETKQKAWFETLPVNRAEHHQVGQDEIKQKAKSLEDPLIVMNRLTGTDQRYLSSTGSIKQAAAASASDSCPSQATGTSGLGNCAKHSTAFTDERSAKKLRKDKKHRHKNRKETKKHKTRKQKSRSEPTASKKRRRRSPSTSSSSDSSEGSSSAEEAEVRRIRMERLRAERLQRERQERERADRLVNGLRGEPPQDQNGPPEQPRPKQRYNAQFNPYLARQNYRHH